MRVSDAKARVARGATYIFGQGLVNMLLGAIYFMVLTRALEDQPEEVGVYALLVFILGMPTVFGTLALPQAAVKHMPQYIAQNNSEKAKSVVARLLQIGLISSTIVFVLIFVPAEWLSAVLFSKVDYAPLLRVVGLASAFNILYVFASCFLQALQRFRDMAIVGFVYTVAQNALGIILLYFGWRLYAVAYGWLVGLASGSIVGLIITARHLGVSGKPHEIKPLFQYSRSLYVGGIISYFVGWADQLILVTYMGLIHGASEAQIMLGTYYVAIRASIVPALFSSSVITALFPKLSELHALQGSKGMKDAFYVSTRYAVLVGFPLIIGLATLARPSVILFAGLQWIGAAEPLMIICIGALVSTIGVAAGPILLALGRTAISSVISTISVALSLLLSYVALAYLGLETIGTAWARTIASIIGVVLTLYAMKHYVVVSFDKEALWKGSLASAFMVLVIIFTDLMRKLVSSAPYEFLVIRLHVLPVYIAIGGIAYFIALAALKAIKKRDVELVKGYLPRMFKEIVARLERFAVDE